MEEAYQRVSGKREKVEFSISLRNRLSTLSEKANLSVQGFKNNLTSIITECAVAVGGKIVRPNRSSQETKGVIKKRQNMKASNTTYRTEHAELSK